MEELRQRLVQFLEDNSQQVAREVEKLQNAENERDTHNLDDKDLNIPDANSYLSFLTEALKMNDDEIYSDYIKWVKLLLREQDISEEIIHTMLNLIKDVLNGHLTPDLSDVFSRYHEAGIKQLKEPVKESDSYIDINAPLGKLAKSYNEALLNGDKNSANGMVMEAVKVGTSIKDIYLHVFQKSQLEVGRLWLMNEITVAKEHYASAATQLIMSQLYPYIFNTERVGHTFVGACIGGELHELGIRMVGDFFEMEGWDTYYLGANTPVTTIISAIEENHADVIGLSVSMPYYRSIVKEGIDEIRQHFGPSCPKILVGGNGINHNKEVWKYLGADGYGSDAQEAVDRANQLIK